MLAYLTFVFYPFAEMEAAKQRALIRASVTTCKQKEKEGASTSAPKVVGKGAAKQKSYGKDDLPLKKGPGTPAGDKQSKQPSSSKSSHEAGKGLMTVTGPVTQGIVRRLFTHKNISLRWLSQSSRRWKTWERRVSLT